MLDLHVESLTWINSSGSTVMVALCMVNTCNPRSISSLAAARHGRLLIVFSSKTNVGVCVGIQYRVRCDVLCCVVS